MSNPPRNDEPGDRVPEIDTLENEEFLTRWSRRKALSREGVDLPEPTADTAREDRTQPGAAEDASGAALPENAEQAEGQASDTVPAAPALPPIESLGEDSDYRAFLAADVPPDLQREALRKLFRSPKFNVRDGLDDYDLDFTSPEPLGDIVTAEMRHRLRVEFERLVELEDDGDESARDEESLAAVEADESDNQEEPADSEPDDEQPATA